MNRLALVNRARVECAASGASQPLASTLNVTGESKRFVDWVSASWIDIQTAHDNWDFMRSTVQFNTTAQQQAYTPVQAGITKFGRWDEASFRVSTDTSFGDEQALSDIPYDTFRDVFMFGASRTTYARPSVVSVTPAKALALGPVPDAAYVVNGEYFLAPSDFSSDEDSPTIPERFHMLIVYRVMFFYAGYEAASEVYQTGLREYNRLMSRLEIDQLPRMTLGAPLA